MSDITFKMTAVSNVGLVRTNNEDNFIVNPDLDSNEWAVPSDTEKLIPLGKHGCLMVVADGMGGMNAGEVASEIAVTTIRNTFANVPDFDKVTDTPGHIESFMKKAIVTADSDIKRRVKDDPSTEGMGTTVVMVWVLENVAHVAWCGDSRAYLFNRQSGLSRLSRDHSYVQQLVDSGKLDADLAFDHPNSNIITRSLGDSNTVAQPDYVSRGLSAGDVILLCSDGLCGLVRDEEILDVLMAEHESVDECRDALLASALNAGGHDNVTIALMECVHVQERELDRTLTATVKPRKKSKAWIWVLIVALLAAGAYFAGQKGLIEKAKTYVESVFQKAPASDNTASEETPEAPEAAEDGTQTE
ncbi:MAG: serine/threonine-protein phosphatase [Bacteroidales bacterium]|nr:serine/threonine-protein phosphatase [Bacteroidales bacterium]